MTLQTLEEYAASISTKEDAVLHELYRETHLKMMYPRMVSGHIQGRLLEMLSRMIRPDNILEIGTFTGYSAICLAKGLQPGGKLHTIEINQELVDFASAYFAKAGLNNRIEQHTGHALEIIPRLIPSWDLVFIDADKENYRSYFDLVLPRLRTGGFIVADNVLWDGKVLQPGKHTDKETAGIVTFNEFVSGDDRVEQVVLTDRDGLMIIRKV